MANGTLKVENIQTSSGSGTITLGQSGETITIPTGTTVSGAMSSTPAFEAIRSGTQSIANTTAVKVEYDSEIFDTDSAYDNSTNYRFTPQVAGKYFCFAQIMMNYGGSDFNDLQVRIHKNGTLALHTRNRFTAYNAVYAAGILDLNGSTDYIEAFCYQAAGGAINVDGGTDNKTRFGAYRIIGA